MAPSWPETKLVSALPNLTQLISTVFVDPRNQPPEARIERGSHDRDGRSRMSPASKTNKPDTSIALNLPVNPSPVAVPPTYTSLPLSIIGFKLQLSRV